MAPIRCCFDQTAVWHSDAARGPSTPSLDHLVGAGEQRWRHFETERLRGNQIHNKLELRRLLDWYIAGLGPAQYLVDVICRAPKTFGVTWSIGHEAPASDKIASAEDRWKPRTQGKRKDAHEIGDHELIDCNIKGVSFSPERLEGRTKISHSTDFQWHDFYAKRASGILGLAHLQHGLGIAHIEDDC